MKQREQAKIKVLNTVLEYHLPIAQAAEIMGVSERHAKRLLAAYRMHGAAALAPREPGTKAPQCRARRRSSRCGEAGQQSLFRRQPQPLHRVAQGAGGHRPEPAHGAPHPGQGWHRQSEEPPLPATPVPAQAHAPGGDAHSGGRQPHPWLEDRADKFVLLLAVDDATGTVAQAVFRTTEDTRGYLVLLEGLVEQWGIPLALYSDRHGAFKYNARQGGRCSTSPPSSPG